VNSEPRATEVTLRLALSSYVPRIPTLVTHRLVLRPVSPGDFNDLTSLFGDPDAMRYVGNNKTFTPVQVAHMVETMLAEARHGSLHPQWVPGVPGSLVMVHRATQEFVGMGVLRMLAADIVAALGETPEPSLEAGYILAKPFWGQGLATEAASALVSYGVSLVGREHVIAIAHEGNAASHRVLEKVGFERRREFVYREMAMNYWELATGA
jgi:RimJ/RimL family protein N-acetyltransferase